MVRVNRREHWDRVYGEEAGREVSWFQAEPVTSLEFIRHCGGTKHSAIIDVGGGDSRLVDHLVADGFVDVTVLDISLRAIARSKQRLGAAAERAHWITADITRWMPARRYRLWHDRAVLHFLTERKDREAYVRALSAAVERAGCVVISTFALDGPERCSGLPVRRYSEETLAEELGPAFELVEAACDDHHTPSGAV